MYTVIFEIKLQWLLVIKAMPPIRPNLIRGIDERIGLHSQAEDFSLRLWVEYGPKYYFDLL